MFGAAGLSTGSRRSHFPSLLVTGMDAVQDGRRVGAGTEGEGNMTNAFSSMEYPHWLIVAGAVLLLLGVIGLALRRRKGAEATANGNEQGRSEFDAVFAQTRH